MSAVTTAKYCSCGKPFPHCCDYVNDEGDHLGPFFAYEIQGRVYYELAPWLEPTHFTED